MRLQTLSGDFDYRIDVMEFRDLKRQYEHNKAEIDKAIQRVLNSVNFIQGKQVRELEEELSDYVGVKHCITCANGTDALQLALMAWGVGAGDVVFVPDFTFFACGEVVAAVGAKPVFVDVDIDTYNIDVCKLEMAVKDVIKKGEYVPKAVIAVDLFGQPADYPQIRQVAEQYGLYILEDGAQGFGGVLGDQRACSFGDISTTSFFPAKPLGCYGDGGAVFTNSDDWATLIRSYAVHGKGESKYDNVHIGMNSRMDTLQAAVLLAKFPIFIQKELGESNRLARYYTKYLEDIIKTPVIKEGYYSSWAQYTIQLRNGQDRKYLQKMLKEEGIPSVVYYPKPMHRQTAFAGFVYDDLDYPVTNALCESVLSLPFHPYMSEEEVQIISERLKGCIL